MTDTQLAFGQENKLGEPAEKMQKVATKAVQSTPVANLLVKRLTKDATLPKRGSDRAAGFDLAR